MQLQPAARTASCGCPAASRMTCPCASRSGSGARGPKSTLKSAVTPIVPATRRVHDRRPVTASAARIARRRILSSSSTPDLRSPLTIREILHRPRPRGPHRTRASLASQTRSVRAARTPLRPLRWRRLLVVTWGSGSRVAGAWARAEWSNARSARISLLGEARAFPVHGLRRCEGEGDAADLEERAPGHQAAGVGAQLGLVEPEFHRVENGYRRCAQGPPGHWLDWNVPWHKTTGRPSERDTEQDSKAWSEAAYARQIDSHPPRSSAWDTHP